MATEGEESEQRLHRTEHELAAAREDGDDVGLARALVRRARALDAVGRRDGGLADLAEVIARFPAGDDLELRTALSAALELRLVWSDLGDAEILDGARELFAVCRDQPGDLLERRAALALGRQADAQARLGDRRAAIATRRWLLSEFGDVRPRSRPDLIVDHRYMLADDLLDEDRLAECEQACDALVAALGESEASLPQTRLADAMALTVYALWRRGERARAFAVGDELQRRFAASEEPTARASAARALATRIRAHLRDDDVSAALADGRELLARVGGEPDEATRTRNASVLQLVADDLVASFGPVTFVYFTMAVARVAEVSPGILRRRRLHRAAMALARVDAATTMTRVLEDRYRDDPSPAGRAILGRAVLERAAIATRRGRLLRAASAANEFLGLGAPVAAAVLESARPIGSRRYRIIDQVAALLATTGPLPAGDEGERTRATIRAILGSSSLCTPPGYVKLQLRQMDR